MEHFLEAAKEGKADILLAASVFYFEEINIRKLKQYLRENGLEVNQ